ncbi:MAG: calcium/proton exchanger [Deinococcus sp.]|nr:calcium/proton exchanger [Deinococcus sp.]
MLYWLLIFVPMSIVLELVHAPGLWIFASSALAIVPLAAAMGSATDELAKRTGPTVGGLLNATFGNLTELIIAFIALFAGRFEVVKASISGSIISNILLVLGLSILCGGLRRTEQRFNSTAAGTMAAMMLLAVIALVMPAIFDIVAPPEHALPLEHFSEGVAVVLILIYALSLVFSLVTHQSLFSGEEHATPPTQRLATSLLLLLGSTVLVALEAEFLVGSIEQVVTTLGLSEFFIGIIVIPVVGNAAEHFAAVVFAMRNQMDLAVNVALGSTIQVAVLIAPILVLVGAFLGPNAQGEFFDLLFTPLEVTAVALAVLAANLIAIDGTTNWLEGAQLLAVYLIMGLAFFFLPS